MATTTKTAYKAIIPKPIPLFIFQPKAIIVTTNTTSISNKSPIEQNNPSELTAFGAPPLKAMYNIQGNGRPIVTSNKFEPIDELTAISPKPFLATMTDVSKSGTLVPAAKIVSPIMVELIFQVSPNRVTHQTIR